MTRDPDTEEPVRTREILGDLQQLIAALDRRVPQLERIGEADIARDAAELRKRALDLISRITARPAD